MSENVNDLYTKGLTAYSSKEFAKAKAYWEKVLEQDPTHEKAKRGLAELAKLKSPRKRSSKEVLQEIKRLYGAKKYREALKLCELLLRKYPNNEDLQGLRKKIASKVQLLDDSLSSSVEEGHETGESNLESTMVLTQKAEAFVNAVAKGKGKPPAANDQLEKKVEDLIQLGVSHYEVQDYERAIQTWEEALALDPGNRIVRDYMANAKASMQEQAELEADADPNKPSKDEMLEAYNAGLAAYQEKRFDDAMERWDYILKHYPNHKETQQCLEKTQKSIEAHRQGKEDLEQARKLLASGKAEEAEAIANRLQQDVPELDGLTALQEAIDKRKQQINEIRTMELEEKASSQTESTYSASDDEITQYFTPASDGDTEARQVTRVIAVKKEKAPFNWKLWILTPALVAIVAAAGWLFYDYQQKQLRTTDPLSSMRLPVQEVSWNSPEQKAQDFFDMAADFYQSGEFALAVLGYNRSLDIAQDRLAEINAIPTDEHRLEITKELESLSRLVTQATEEKAQAEKSVQLATVEEAAIKDARRALERGQFDEASPVLLSAIYNNSDDQELRILLAQTFESKGFEEIKKQELSEALRYFRRAAVLHPAFELPRGHTEVIERFFRGDISAIEKDQWFFFFQNS